MGRAARAIGVATALAMSCVTGAAASAQDVRVGMPGCADDVAVRASRELITFESRGRQIRGYLYAPGGQPNGQGVVMLHGGTGFEMNAVLFDAHAIQLASRGYSVLLPAYFDAGQPDQSRRLVTGRAWRQAAVDAMAYLEGRPGVEAGRVSLWGYSRGAGVALAAVVRPDGGDGRAVLVAGGGEVDEALNGRKVSTLLLHARRDEAVPVSATLELAGELRDAGATVEVVELAFDGHQYDLPTWCAVMQRTRAFLETDRGGDHGSS